MALYNPSKISAHLINLIILVIFVSCARKSNPNVERGNSYKYIRGYPEARFSTIGFLNEDGVPTLNISANIILNSLIYKKADSTQKASVSVELRIVQQEPKNSENLIVETKQYNYSFQKSGSSGFRSQNSFDFKEQVKVKPGTYKVTFTLTDDNSGKTLTHDATTSIPDPENNVLDLTEIRMLGKDMDADTPGWTTINTYDVPQKIDSLLFIFQVTNNSAAEPLTVNTTLLKFKSDLSIADPMYFTNASPSTITYKGIDLTEETIVEQRRRDLTQKGSVLIEIKFARQERGNYRLQVETNKEEANLFKARDYGVKSENYPELKTAEEIARPLAYLMNEKEYEALMAISDPDSLKKEIDRFWLKNIGNRNEATNVLQLYYERVEEANKQFANFKEGWKTDQGMVYILFGPPWYVNRRLDQVLWSYSYNRSDPNRNYLYIKPKIQSEYFPFKHNLLQRSQQYFNIEYQQRELWLSGLILQRRL